MSMIQCPECNKEISDSAQKCPNCGYPIRKASPTSQKWMGWLTALLLFVAGVILTGVIRPLAIVVLISAIVIAIISIKNKTKLFGISIAVLVLSCFFVLGNLAVLGSGDSSSKNNNQSSMKKTQSDSAITTSTEADTETETTSEAMSEAKSEVTKEEAAPQQSPASESQALGIGSTYEENGLKVTLNEFNPEFTSDNQFETPGSGKKFIEINFTYENTGQSGDRYASIYDFDCYADNTVCEQKYLGDLSFINTNLSPGRNVTFSIYYEVPVSAQKLDLEYKINSIWSDKKVLFTLQ